MKSKQNIRKQLEAGMAVYLGSGKQITKVEALKPRGRRSSQPKEEIIEIEVDHLPKALQDKFFGE